MIENLRSSKILFKVKILNRRSTLEILRFNNLKVIKKETFHHKDYSVSFFYWIETIVSSPIVMKLNVTNPILFGFQYITIILLLFIYLNNIKVFIYLIQISRRYKSL